MPEPVRMCKFEDGNRAVKHSRYCQAHIYARAAARKTQQQTTEKRRSK